MQGDLNKTIYSKIFLTKKQTLFLIETEDLQ